MDWWVREENEQLSPEAVDRAYRALVLPGVANMLGLEIEIPRDLQPGMAAVQ
jgi:hypothetical protein